MTKKKSFFDHPYYKWNKIFLSNIGVWPEQPLIVSYVILLVIWCFIMTVIIPELVNLARAFKVNNVDDILEGLAPIFTRAVAFIQLINGCVNRRKFTLLLDRITLDWKRFDQFPNIDIIHKYAARACLMTKAYSLMMYLGTTSYLFIPILPIILDVVAPLNETRQRTFLYQCVYPIDSEKYYWTILTHMYVTTGVVIAIIISNDVMFFAIVDHACALFEIVGVNLKLVKQSIAKDDPSRDKAYEMMCHCIDLHKEAIHFADLIETTYSNCLVGVIGFSVLTLSFTGVQTVMHLDEIGEVFEYGTFSLAQISHLYFNSVPGQKLMDYSMSVFYNAYENDWEDLSLRAQQLQIMIMMRSLQPCQLTAGKIYIVTLENYSSVMQTSMSYFTLLTSMR